MRNLLRILGLYKYSISFWILVIFSFFFLLNNNLFLKSYYFNSSNYISGTIFSLRNSFINYFELKSQNIKILDENNDLFAQILYYESNKKSNVDTLNVRYRLISANVINNSINKNMMKGSKQFYNPTNSSTFDNTNAAALKNLGHLNKVIHQNKR